MESYQVHILGTSGCGFMCVSFITGKFNLEGENHIRFFIEKINRSFTCNEPSSEPNIDLGLFYIFRDSNSNKIELVKSDGNIKNDKIKIEYKKYLNSTYDEVKKYDDVLNTISFGNFKFESKSIKEIVDYCMLKNNIKNYKILYSMPSFDYQYILVLVEIKGKNRLIFYNNQVTLYDDNFVKKIDQLINKINKYKRLKTKIIEEKYNEKTSTKNTIELIYKNNKVIKLIFKEDYCLNYEFLVSTVVYFQNSKPIYLERETESEDKENKYNLKTGYYFVDLKSKFISKEFQNPAESLTSNNYYNHIGLEKIKSIIELCLKYK